MLSTNREIVFRVPCPCRDVSCEALGQSRGVSWIRFLLLLLFRAVAVALGVPLFHFHFHIFPFFICHLFRPRCPSDTSDVAILAQAILAQAGKIVRVSFERVPMSLG